MSNPEHRENDPQADASQGNHLSRETHSTGPMDLLSRVWAAGLGCLVLATFPLWMPGIPRSQAFPKIPWVAAVPWAEAGAEPGANWAMAAIDAVALITLAISILALVIDGRRRRPWWGIVISLLILICADQHRLQPWAYQSILYGVLLAGLPRPMARRWVMAVAISVYFYSAAGKLDYQFAHTVGKQMIEGLARPFGGVGDVAAVRLALLLPAAELVVSILLMIPLTRRLGGWAAVAMHVTLIGLLGPWSLDHSWGVLTWNVLLGTQAMVLFCLGATEERSETFEPAYGSQDSKQAFSRAGFGANVIRVAVLVSLIMPLSERSGIWDHWPSWALYSPHNSRADIQVHQSAIDQLPQAARDYLSDTDGDGWNDLDVERWSLDRCLVPIYPQLRYQLALANRFAQAGPLGQAVRVKAKQASDRWDGSRKESFLIGENEIRKELDRYWLTGR